MQHAPRRVPILLCVLACVGALGARCAVADEADDSLRGALEALARGEHALAQQLAQRATALAPSRGSAWLVDGFVRSRTGDATAALSSYREAARLDPRDAVAHNNLGALLIEQGDPEGALAPLGAALAQEPAYADALNNRGAALERLGRTAEARSTYEQVTRRAPRHAVALTNLGTLRWKDGDRTGAEQAWRRALALDPELAAPALNLVVAAGGADEEQVLAALERETAKPGAPPSVRVQALRAQAAREARQRRWPQARQLLEQALRLAPWDARVLNDLGVSEDQLGLDREALAHLDEALRREPGLLVAQNNVGIVHVHRGATDAAIEAFEELLARDPRFHRAHHNLGVLRAAEGNAEAARRHFQEAARLAPRDASVRYNLGLLEHEQGGDAAGERRAYEDALALDPGLAEAHLSLGMLLADPATPAALRDESRALEHLQRFLDLAAPSDGDGRVQARAWLRWMAERGATR